jgi:hypothetical protein
MKTKLLFTILMLVSSILFAQAPQGINYQTVIRGSNGLPLQNQAVGLKFNIKQGSISGTIVYSETHNVTTNQLALVNVVVGEGTVTSGNFSNINWANGTYFIETEVDVTGGSNYQVLGTQQLMSVPYALYAETAGGGIQGPPGRDATILSLTTTQQDSIPAPPMGMLIYNKTTGCFNFYNGTAWEGLTGEASTWYADVDGDGFGNPSSTVLSCKQPNGYVAIAGDCNDNDVLINPDSPELCDGLDQNCNGLIDDGVFRSCYSGPAGTEGVGICQAGTQTCTNGSWGICINSVLPQQEIPCNGLDDNCDGFVDEIVTPSVANGALICSNGTYTLSCFQGFTDCDGDIFNGCETNVISDANNCGNCNTVCPQGMSCNNGVCQ